MAVQARELTKDYKYGFHDEDISVFRTAKGLSPEVVAAISQHKSEPEWMLQFRLKALYHFRKRPMPTWSADLSGIDFENIYYYVKPVDEMGRTWDDVPESIKRTFDRLGIPDAERQFLAGVSAQYDSEVVYHNIREDLEKIGVIFGDCDTGLREHEEIFRKYFGTVIPPNDNKFAALNSAVWSGGSFVYVPKGVQVDIPLQAYFRINSDNMGRFEGDPRRAQHHEQYRVAVHQQGQRPHLVPRTHQGAAQGARREGERPLRRTAPRRGVAQRHVSIHGHRQPGRHRGSRGDREQGRRGSDLLPHVPRHRRAGRHCAHRQR